MKYIDNAYYHIYNRGAHKALLFSNEIHFSFCQKKLIEYAQKYTIGLLAYCFMPNHYHLLVQQHENGSISRFLQTTFNSFTQFVNTREGHSGTMFQGRAQSRQITTDEYLIVALRYIHLNPVQAGIVKSPAEWKHSDYAEWISEKSNLITTAIGKERRNFRNLFFESGSEYRRFILDNLNKTQTQHLNDITNLYL